MPTPAEPMMPVAWAWAGSALEAAESGDLHVVVPLPRGALLAVIDGLGHGPEAALAAREAAGILRARAALPVSDLIELCHEGLRKTRGAVMSVASLHVPSATIDCCGVGNVEGVLFHTDGTREAIATRGGVVGYRLPRLRISTLTVSIGDTLVFVTDGIASDFTSVVELEADPDMIADSVLARCAKGTDDALVLVVRYLGAMS
jgi:serine phosphatase RsbU (regulator of sigma subunit)